MGQIKYSSPNATKNTGPEAVINLSQFNDFIIISTVLNNYFVEINDEDLFETIEYEEKKYTLDSQAVISLYSFFLVFSIKIYNAKLLSFEFGETIGQNLNADEFIINKMICVNVNKLCKCRVKEY